MRSDLQYRMRSFYICGSIAKTRIEETRIMNSEFADVLVNRYHFCRPFRRNTDFFLGGKNVEISGFKDQSATAAVILEIPEVLGRVVVDLCQVDDRSISLCLVCDHFRGITCAQ